MGDHTYDDTILTELFCFYLRSEPNKDMQVLAGSLSLNKPDPGAQIIPVQNAIQHASYRETSTAVYNDIGNTRFKCLRYFV